MDFYVNPRINNVRIVQYVTAGGAVGIALIALSEGEPSLAVILALVGGACVFALERFFVCRYVTRLRKEASGWVMTTLSTFGERQVGIDPTQVQIGERIEQHDLYGGVAYHYPLRVGAVRYIVDCTPPATFDAEALRRALAAG